MADHPPLAGPAVSLAPRMVLNSAARGAAVAVVITVLLAAGHALAGPTLINSGSTLTETLIVIALGAGAGAALAVLGRSR